MQYVYNVYTYIMSILLIFGSGNGGRFPAKAEFKLLSHGIRPGSIGLCNQTQLLTRPLFKLIAVASRVPVSVHQPRR